MNLLRIGTRCSPLSLKQASLAGSFLSAGLGQACVRFDFVKITTSGDRVLDKPLYAIGGKGLFTKELDRALLDGRIDIAVHSAKDMESVLPAGLVIACYLPRGDRRDCLITASERVAASSKVSDAVSSDAISTGDSGVMDLLRLAKNSRLGTTSPRRRQLVRLLREDLELTLLRGNIERRLHSLRSGQNDAIILACCALERLGTRVAMSKLDEERFLPAAGQGAIAMVIRAQDGALRDSLLSISDSTCRIEVSAERAFLRRIGGDCHSALGASARLTKHGHRHGHEHRQEQDERLELALTAFVIEDGKKQQRRLSEVYRGSCDDTAQAESLGKRLANRLSPAATGTATGTASALREGQVPQR